VEERKNLLYLFDKLPNNRDKGVYGFEREMSVENERSKGNKNRDVWFEPDKRNRVNPDVFSVSFEPKTETVRIGIF